MWVIYGSVEWIVFVLPACRPSCVAKTLALNITRKLFFQFFFHTSHAYRHIDFYHFIPLSLTLTLPGVSRSAQSKVSWVSTEQKPLHTFNWSGWNLIWCWRNLGWTSWYYFWALLNKTREITTDLLTASKSFNLGMRLDITKIYK